MRFFNYNVQEHDHPVMITDEEILKDYYPYYAAQMKKVGKENEISNANCLENWCIVNYGWEVDQDGNARTETGA